MYMKIEKHRWSQEIHKRIKSNEKPKKDRASGEKKTVQTEKEAREPEKREKRRWRIIMFWVLNAQAL